MSEPDRGYTSASCPTRRTPSSRAQLVAERDRVNGQISELGVDRGTFDEGFADSGQVTAERGEVDALVGHVARDPERHRRRAREDRGRRPTGSASRAASRSARRVSRRCRRPGSASPAPRNVAEPRRSQIDHITIICRSSRWSSRSSSTRSATVSSRLWFGDDTARRAGRLTLNPIPHIDPFGSIILPALGALTGFPVIGWAKPVPVEPETDCATDAATCCWSRSPGRPRTSRSWCSPRCVTQVMIAGSVYATIDDLPLVAQFLFLFAVVNLFLGLFNLLPIPPLDGSAMLERVLPGRAARDVVPDPALRHPRAVPARVLHQLDQPHVQPVPRTTARLHQRLSDAETARSAAPRAPVLRIAPRARARPRRGRSGAGEADRDRVRGVDADVARGSGRIGRDARTASRVDGAATTPGPRPPCCTTSARPRAGSARSAASPRPSRGHLGDPEDVGGRTGAYLRHAELGAELLEHAGARPETVAWARTHHDRSRWPTDLIPAPVCAALARADGET